MFSKRKGQLVKVGESNKLTHDMSHEDHVFLAISWIIIIR